MRVNIAWLEQLSSWDYKIIRFKGMSDIEGHINVPLPEKVNNENLLIGFVAPGYMSKMCSQEKTHMWNLNKTNEIKTGNWHFLH